MTRPASPRSRAPASPGSCCACWRTTAAMHHTLWVPHKADLARLQDRLPSGFGIRAYRATALTARPGATDLVVTPYAAPTQARAVIEGLPPGATVQALEAGIDALIDAV